MPRPEIGIDDADQVELGKVMPLGDELRADDDVDAALRDVVEFLAQPLDRWRRGRSTAPGCARRGNSSRDLLLEPLDARADRRRSKSAAWHFGHAAGGGIGEAAMVADELPPEAVLDQPGVAVRAVEAEAAGAAERQRRIAAAVEEQQRLLAALERGLDGVGERAAR